MAKAIFGHMGGPDPRLLADLRRLQQRVQQLEAEVGRLQTENDALRIGALEHDLHHADIEHGSDLSSVKEPALA